MHKEALASLTIRATRRSPAGEPFLLLRTLQTLEFFTQRMPSRGRYKEPVSRTRASPSNGFLLFFPSTKPQRALRNQAVLRSNTGHHFKSEYRLYPVYMHVWVRVLRTTPIFATRRSLLIICKYPVLDRSQNPQRSSYTSELLHSYAQPFLPEPMTTSMLRPAISHHNRATRHLCVIFVQPKNPNESCRKFRRQLSPLKIRICLPVFCPTQEPCDRPRPPGSSGKYDHHILCIISRSSTACPTLASE